MNIQRVFNDEDIEYYNKSILLDSWSMHMTHSGIFQLILNTIHRGIEVFQYADDCYELSGSEYYFKEVITFTDIDSTYFSMMQKSPTSYFSSKCHEKYQVIYLFTPFHLLRKF